MEDGNIIKVGDHVIVQRQGYTKLQKIKERGFTRLGQFKVRLGDVIGKKYYDTFQMINIAGTKHEYMLEKVQEVNSASNLNIKTSGHDNRNIVADDQSQKLTKDEIEKLIGERLSSNNIVENLINNSTSFGSKTEYSQEKYIKKKQKKYFEYIQIRRPTIRLLTEMYNRQDPWKSLYMRLDDLSQILAYANVQSTGDYLLFDSGTSGLMSAAILNAIGAQTTGRLIHVHLGNECQRTAVLAMQFPEEQMARCINVNLYSVLRCYYQHQGTYSEYTKGEKANTKRGKTESTKNVKKAQLVNNEEQTESMETEDDQVSAADLEETKKDIRTNDDDDDDDDTGEPSEKKMKLEKRDEPKRPGWQFENEKACAILKNKVDSVILVVKEHPMNLTKELVNFLKGGCRVVVYSASKEPLQELYLYFKSKPEFVYLKLSNNFMRNYQVLPDRTHPQVMMTNGGYIFSAYKLSY